MRGLLGRLLAAITRLVLRGFFRDVEVVGAERVPRGRPLLVVANHFNALVDAALLVDVLGGLPRFVAKAGLWDRVWARPLLWLAGLVPVRRRQDGGDLSNTSMFATCHELLARGRVVALFPEGVVSTRPSLARVRTGAARIALGARNRGARGLVVLPVGLMYEDKVALRSRALVRVGEPIDLDEELPSLLPPGSSPSERDHAAVRRLTDEIAARMTAVTPDYADERESAVLALAAEVALRARHRIPPPPVPLRRRETLSQRLARASPARRERLFDALARYELDLSLLGVQDRYLVAGYSPRRLAQLLVTAALQLALLAPFALVGGLVNALPYWGVHWAGRAVRTPTLKGTARLLVGLVLFPLTWVAVILALPWTGWTTWVAGLVAAPVLGLVAVGALERAIAAHGSWRGWISVVERRDALAQVREDRDRLVALVEELDPSATAAAPAGTDGGPREVEDVPGLG